MPFRLAHILRLHWVLLGSGQSNKGKACRAFNNKDNNKGTNKGNNNILGLHCG